MSGVTIRWVFFDLGDTLVRIKPQIYQEWAKEISSIQKNTVTEQELVQAIKAEWNQTTRTGPNLLQVRSEADEVRFLQDLYRSALRRLGSCLPNRPDVKKRCRWLRLIDRMVQETLDPSSFELLFDVAATVDELKEQGIGVGIISNAFASTVLLLNSLEQIKNRFDPIVLSYGQPFAKPEEEIYRTAARLAGVRFQEASYVDDRPAFVEAAAKMGMDAMLPEQWPARQRELRTAAKK